jgi:hypothetical protein
MLCSFVSCKRNEENVYVKKNIEVSGNVIDFVTKEPIQNATVVISNNSSSPTPGSLFTQKYVRLFHQQNTSVNGKFQFNYETSNRYYPIDLNVDYEKELSDTSLVKYSGWSSGLYGSKKRYKLYDSYSKDGFFNEEDKQFINYQIELVPNSYLVLYLNNNDANDTLEELTIRLNNSKFTVVDSTMMFVLFTTPLEQRAFRLTSPEYYKYIFKVDANKLVKYNISIRRKGEPKTNQLFYSGEVYCKLKEVTKIKIDL